MNISKRNSIIFSLLALLVVYIEYKSTNTTDYELPNKNILYFDETIFKLYEKKFNIDKDLNRYWGFAKEKSLFETEENNVSNKQEIEVTKEMNENVLCIGSSCYRLLGIHNNKRTPYVTLYNKKLKEKIKDYTNGDILEYAISIVSIKSNSVVIEDLNSSQTWEFKIFDVNQTKYIPKEIEE